ncbi:hypothetical protein DFH06DRAFT_1197286 [Mycena polygramma]|nr:hypothetical protein DFH06DRAFT_1197286 [Mycena polygramma]
MSRTMTLGLWRLLSIRSLGLSNDLCGPAQATPSKRRSIERGNFGADLSRRLPRRSSPSAMSLLSLPENGWTTSASP